MNAVIIGNGGVSRELQAYMAELQIEYSVYVSDEYHHREDNTFKLSELDVKDKNIIIAIADPNAKEKIVSMLPKETAYFSFVHPMAIIYSTNSIGQGTIIGPNAVITTDVTIGEHCLINYNVTIGHDTVINDYCTVNPGAAISGNCVLGKNVFVGSHAGILEKTKIADYNKIGMGCVVIRDIESSNGTYVGVPARKL
jgi:sugar O-acyltransferase (sialic acid O-acetyltransferase NeuD family)